MTARLPFSASACPTGRRDAVLAVPRQAQLEDSENDSSAVELRIVRGWFVEAAERAARWEPAPCPEMLAAIERVAAMEREEP